VSKKGLPMNIQMRHDSHYVEEISRTNRTIGRSIDVKKIAPNPEQPRSEFGDLTDLTNSIKEKGVLEPLLVRPNGDGTFMIIAGERRWRASQAAGLTEVPCIEMDLDEQGVAEIALIENLQRKDLTVWEEADGLAALSEKYGYTHDEIAKQISKSRSTVTEFLTIAGLPESVREKCLDAKIDSKSTLLGIARQFDEEAMLTYTDELVSGKRPKKAAKEKAEKPPAAASAEKKSSDDGRTFTYSARGFKLNIEFSENAPSGREAVLKALKEAFASVKNQKN
jgi:ParB family chromosome partitioning protein